MLALTSNRWGKRNSLRVLTALTWLATRLTGAFFCGTRLCPLCAKARSDKLYAEVLQVDEALRESEPGLVVLMLTLTDRKPWLCDLGEAITQRNAAFARLSKRERFRRSIVGWLRAMEMPAGEDGRVHPHFHVLLWVREQEYFGTDLYIEHAEWQGMWKQCSRIDYTPQVRIERLRSFREGTKYAVKDGDFVKPRCRRVLTYRWSRNVEGRWAYRLRYICMPDEIEGGDDG
jgi:plasmid rolling circle replication initiator protein Rep